MRWSRRARRQGRPARSTFDEADRMTLVIAEPPALEAADVSASTDRDHLIVIEKGARPTRAVVDDALFEPRIHLSAAAVDRDAHRADDTYAWVQNRSSLSSASAVTRATRAPPGVIHSPWNVSLPPRSGSEPRVIRLGWPPQTASVEWPTRRDRITR